MDVTAKYTCKLCRIDKRDVRIPAREGMPVDVWLDKVADAVGADHSRVSPRCPAQSVDELMVPVDDDAKSN